MNPKVKEDGRYEVIRTLKEGEERRLPDYIRRIVLRRDRCQCMFCGNKGRLEVDHIIPWSAGGSDDLDNLRTLCHRCNQERSNYASESDTAPRRFLNAHECVYCNADLIGEAEVVQVYCIQCNKRAPGLPINPPEEPPQDYPQFSDDELYGHEHEEFESLAAKYRDDALAVIRDALARTGQASIGRGIE